MKTAMLLPMVGMLAALGLCDRPSASRAQVCATDAECGDARCELGRCGGTRPATGVASRLSTAREHPAFHRGAVPVALPNARLTPRFRLALGAKVAGAPALLPSGEGIVVARDGHVRIFDGEGRVLRELELGFAVLGGPAVDLLGQVLVVGRDGAFRILDPSLRELARGSVDARVEATPTALPIGCFAVPTRGVALVTRSGAIVRRVAAPTPLRGSVAYHPDGFFVFATPEGRLRAHRADGAAHFDVDAGASVEGAPVVTRDGAILVGNDLGEVLRFDASGRRLGRVETTLDVRATPSLLADGRVVVPSLDGHLRILPPSFTDATPPLVDVALFAPLGAQALVDADDRIVVGGHDGRLHLLAPDGRELGFRVVGADLDSPPRLMPDGTLIVASDDDAVHGFR